MKKEVCILNRSMLKVGQKISPFMLFDFTVLPPIDTLDLPCVVGLLKRL